MSTAEKYLEEYNISFEPTENVFICTHPSCQCILHGKFVLNHLHHKNHTGRKVNRAEFNANVKSITNPLVDYGKINKSRAKDS